MKKGLIILLIILAVITATMFFRSPYEMTEQNKLDDYLISQKPRVEKYLIYNYENVGEINLNKVKKTPMGGIYIDGDFIDLSSNKIISFVAKVESNIGVEDVDGISVNFHDKNLKKELDGKTKSVSDIEESDKDIQHE